MFKLDKKGFYILSFPGMQKDHLDLIAKELKLNGVKCIVVDKSFSAHRLD